MSGSITRPPTYPYPPPRQVAQAQQQQTHSRPSQTRVTPTVTVTQPAASSLSSSSAASRRRFWLLLGLAAASSAAAVYAVRYFHRHYTLTAGRPFIIPRIMSLEDPIQGIGYRAEIDRWKRQGVYIPDPISFYIKRKEMQEGGVSQLQIISDFDRTLSSRLSISSHGCLERSPVLPEEYRQKVRKLYDTYYPIEMDVDVPAADKAAAMTEWWEFAHEALMEYGLKHEQLDWAIEYALNNKLLTLRSGAAQMIEMTAKHSIPVLVFSAGLGNCIELILSHCDCLRNNVSIVSNWMLFDETTGQLKGFEGDLIHSLNKNYEHVHRQQHRQKKTPTAESAPTRGNVILLGDHLADIRMTEGLPHVENLLKIGFCNESTPEKIEAYKSVYDAVILNDGSMDFVVDLLRRICSPSQQR